MTTTIAHPPGRLVDLGDTQLWIETEGTGEPLLLLPGGPASSHLVFHPYFSGLDDHQVIYVDYRGRGRSALVQDPSEVTFIGDVADIAILIRHLGLGDADQVLSIVARYYPEEQIPVRARYLVEDLFTRMAEG